MKITVRLGLLLAVSLMVALGTMAVGLMGMSRLDNIAHDIHIENSLREEQTVNDLTLNMMRRDISNALTSTRNTMIILFSAGALLLIVLTITAAGAVTQPIKSLTDVVANLSKGNLHGMPAAGIDYKALTNELVAFSATLTQWKDDITELNKNHAAGHTEALMDEQKYEGAYREAARGINSLLAIYNRDINEILDAVKGLAIGDLRAGNLSFPGKKEQYAKTVNDLKEHMKKATLDFQSVLDEYTAGQKLMNESVNVLEKISKGDISQTITGNHEGDFVKLKNAVNNASASISGYVKEVTALVTDIANASPSHREYTGPLPGLKDAFRYLENYIMRLEKQKSAPTPVSPVRTTFQPRVATPVVSRTATAAATPKKTGGFTPSTPVLSSRTLVAPNASHIYDKKDFGKYK
jgi:methyl-accepting chemotaxis protein